MSRYTSTGPLHGKASDTDTMSATGSEGSGVLLSLSSRSITDSDCAPISTPSASTDHAIDDDGGGIAYSNDSESTHSISSASSPLLTANYTAFILDPADTLTAEFSNLTFAEQTRALAAVRRFNRDESEASRSRPETSYSGSQTSGSRAQTSNNESQASIAGLRSKAKPKQRSNNDGESDKPTLADWQALCKACGILSQDLPESISKCKQTLKNYNVNLADLSEALQNDTVAQRFPSVAALRRYSERENKVRPKAAIKKDKVLKHMLRELFRGGRNRSTPTDSLRT